MGIVFIWCGKCKYIIFALCLEKKYKGSRHCVASRISQYCVDGKEDGLSVGRRGDLGVCKGVSMVFFLRRGTFLA